MEGIEQGYEAGLQKGLATGVRNIQLKEEFQKRGYEIEKLTVLLHESESKLQASNTVIQQLVSQISENRQQHRRMADLQNQVMSENSRLHGTAQTAGTELERTSHVVRDLELANQVMRDENQALSERVQTLLGAVASLREELRGSFRGQEAATAQMAAERREWRAAQCALTGEAEDLRRRLRWLEEGYHRDRERLPAAAPPVAAHRR
jgi:chromosome segregation ATPase